MMPRLIPFPFPFPLLRLLLAVLLAPALSGPARCEPASPAGGARGAPPGYALFGGHPVAFQRTGGKVVAAYLPAWSSPALLDAVPADDLTHVLYAFLHVCGPGQLAADAPRCEGRGDFEIASGGAEVTFDAAFARLKARAPHLAVLASVGGWGGSDPFFHLADTPGPRAAFAASAVAFLRAHPAFDGIDIDWEHPTTNGSANGVALGRPEDGAGYAELMRTLRAALDRLAAETGRRYLLTSAINTAHAIVDKVDYRGAAPALDLVWMMTYDFYGAWSAGAGNHAAPAPSGPGREDGLEAAARTLLAAGVPASKLVAGVAMYGRGFSGLALPARGASFTGRPFTGTYPGPEGSAGWREIAGRLIDERGRGRHGYEAVFDPVTGAWNLLDRRDGLWMGADDPRAVLAKGAFVRRAGLAGLFAWELSLDNGDILNAMNAGVGNLPLRP